MSLLVRDEQDIVDWHIRYHLSRGIDHIIVTDNRSVDRTPELLRRFETTGRISRLLADGDDYSQDLWVSRMARLARDEHGADWILHSDADEFWWPENGNELQLVFASIPPQVRAVKVERHNFLGTSVGLDRPFFERLVYRQRHSVNALGQSLPGKIAHRPIADPYVHQGNHGVSDSGVPVETESLSEVSVFHFPARAPAQLRNKVTVGGQAYARNKRLDPSAGTTWRYMYQELIEGRFEEVLEKHFLPRDGSPREDFVEDHRLRDYLISI